MPPGAQKEDPPVTDQGEKREGPYATSLPDTNKPSSTNPTPTTPTILKEPGVLHQKTTTPSGPDRTTDESLRVGTGAAVGFLLSTVAKLVCALVMIAFYAVSLWNALRVAPP